MWPGFNSRSLHHMQLQFFSSVLCSKRCFLWYYGFPLSPKLLYPAFFGYHYLKLPDWLIGWCFDWLVLLIDWLQTCIGILSSIVLTAFALKRQDAKIWVQLKTLVVEGIYYRCKARIFQSHETKPDTFPNEIELETVHAGIFLMLNSFISSCGSDHVTDLQRSSFLFKHALTLSWKISTNICKVHIFSFRL